MLTPPGPAFRRRVFRHDPQIQPPFAEAKGLLQGIKDALAIRHSQQKSIHHHLDAIRAPVSSIFFQRMDLPASQMTDKSHLPQGSQYLIHG